MEKDDDCIQSTGTLYGSLVDSAKNYDVIPAQAGIQSKNTINEIIAWIPAFAGMTELLIKYYSFFLGILPCMISFL